jgi:hypothetical protein
MEEYIAEKHNFLQARQTMVPTGQEHRNLFCVEIWLYPHELGNLLAEINNLVGKSKHKKAAKFAAVISTTHVESWVPIGQSKYAAVTSPEKRINFGDADYHFPCSPTNTFSRK